MPAISHRRTPSSTALLRIIGRLDVHGGGYDRYHPDTRTTPAGRRASTIRRIRRTPTLRRRSSAIRRLPHTTRRRSHTIARPPLLTRPIPHAPIALAALFHTRTDTLIYVRVDAADVSLPAPELVVAVAKEGAPVVASKGARFVCDGACIVCNGARIVYEGAHTNGTPIPPHSANALSSHSGGPRTLRAPFNPQVAAIAAGRGESPRQRPRFASDWLLESRKGEFLALREAISLVITRRWTLLPDDGSRYALDFSPWPELGRFPRV
ncbi:hypothetical protein EV715DRAFT_203690 [Schizophyllum commune]